MCLSVKLARHFISTLLSHPHTHQFALDGFSQRRVGTLFMPWHFPELKSNTRLSFSFHQRRRLFSSFSNDSVRHQSYQMHTAMKSFIATIDAIKISALVREVLKYENWVKAMKEEMKALEKNSTWEIFDRSKDKKADRTLYQYKVRLVAKGYTQIFGIDYEETFAPIAKMNMDPEETEEIWNFWNPILWTFEHCILSHDVSFCVHLLRWVMLQLYKVMYRFLKVMAMVWAGSQVTKLVRAGGALALAPFVDRGLSWFTDKFKFQSQGKAFMAIVGFCLGLALIVFLVITLLSA
ncbi:hypothetical protein CR513_51453, partial [Mucuna pruriens]